MGRRKIEVKFIDNDSMLRSTFKRRKACVLNKASELSKLCGCRSCVLIDSPDEPHHEVRPSKEEAIEMVNTFKNMQNKGESEKSTSPEEMLHQQAIKTQEEIAKLKQRNHDQEMAILMHEYMTGQRSTSEIGSEEVRGLFRMAEEQLRPVQARIDVFSSNAINVEDATAPISAQEIPRIGESRRRMFKRLRKSNRVYPCA